MILSAHQPAYLPWLGYFDKIARSDVFIFLDSVQFEKNSFTNRNKIKTPQGAIWLTVPVQMQNHTSLTLAQTLIDNKQKWQKKHLNSIVLNYKKAPYFDEIYTLIEHFYLNQYDLLSDYCYDYLKMWLDYFKINTRIVKSSNLNIESKKSDLVLDLCKAFNADYYISGALGKNYLEEEKFKENKIKIEYQDYKITEYSQLWGDFLPYAGVIDLAFNKGSVLDIIINKNTEKEET